MKKMETYNLNADTTFAIIILHSEGFFELCSCRCSCCCGCLLSVALSNFDETYFDDVLGLVFNELSTDVTPKIDDRFVRVLKLEKC